MKKLFYFALLSLIYTGILSAQIQQDTSSYFPLGLWGIWIDQDAPPFTRNLNSSEWQQETDNWQNINANYLIDWMPVWVEDTIMTQTEPLGYKMDIKRSDFSANGVTDTSLRRWIQTSPNPLTAYWKQRADQKITGIFQKFGNREGFHSYFLAHEGDLWRYNQQDTAWWPAIGYIVDKIKEIDPDHKSYIVHWGSRGSSPFPFGITLSQFAQRFSKLGIYQVDDYVFLESTPSSYTYQQQQLDLLLSSYNDCMTAFKNSSTEWHAIIQTQRDVRENCPSGYLRRPNLYELRVQSYLALSRGAKGITSFVYGSTPDNITMQNLEPGKNILSGKNMLSGVGNAFLSCDHIDGYHGLVDVGRLPYTISHADPDGIPAFTNVGSVYAELQSIGSVIRKLKFYNAFPNISIPSNNSAGIYSVSGDKIEIGTFKRVDEGSDSTNYFMVVNRVCNNTDGSVSSPQNITIVINGFQSIIDQSTDQIISGSYNSGNNKTTFTVSLAPGEGRLFAFDRVIQLANFNKSTIASATAYNNQHILERGHHGHLHEVFASGGEIFYRRSSNNGSSWSITKRLSSGNGDNNSVSIAAGSDPSYDNVRAVWQRKIDNYHYEIWYSYSLNSGSSWAAPAIVNGCSNVTISYYQSPADYAGGPTPVVASYWRGGAEGNASFLLVYAASNGLHFRYADDSNNSWTIPGNDIVPGATSSSSWYPSLATYNSQDYKVYLIYGERFSSPSGHVYYQYFNQDVTWSSRTKADNSNTYNRLASIAVDNSGLPIMAWCGQNAAYSGQNPNGRYTITYKQGSGAYGKEWVESTDAFSPSLTYYNKGGSYPYGVDVLYHTSNKYVFNQVFSGSPTSDWTKNTLANGDGYYPNVTHETSSSGVPKQIWTDQSSSPYSLVYNSNYLPKQNLNANKEFHRAVVITDSLTGSQLRIEITQPVIKTTTGKEIYIPFMEKESYSDLVKSNSFDFLKTEADNLPSDAESISFGVYINSNKPDTLEGGKINTDKSTPFKRIDFENELKNNSDKSLLSSFEKVLLNDDAGNYRYSKTFTLSASNFRNKNVILSPKISFSEHSIKII